MGRPGAGGHLPGTPRLRGHPQLLLHWTLHLRWLLWYLYHLCSPPIKPSWPADPIFVYSGGSSSTMTPMACLESCQATQLSQDYTRKLVIGLSQGTHCFCGFDYEQKLAASSEPVSANPFLQMWRCFQHPCAPFPAALPQLGSAGSHPLFFLFISLFTAWRRAPPAPSRAARRTGRPVQESLTPSTVAGREAPLLSTRFASIADLFLPRILTLL